MFKKITFGFTFYYGIVACAHAQTSAASQQLLDSIKLSYLQEAAKKYPLLRQAGISTRLIANSQVKSTLKGEPFFEGKARISQIVSNVQIPIRQWGKNTLSGSLGYLWQRFQIQDIVSQHPWAPSREVDIHRSTVNVTANISRTDSVFHLPMTFSAGISGLTDQFTAIKRLTYMGSLSAPIKRTENQSMTVGLILLINPSAPTPVFPFFSYWRKLADPNLELFMDLPSRVVLRKTLSPRNWFTIGTEMDGLISFFDLRIPSLPQDVTYSSLDLKSGITFEHLLSKKVILGFSTGFYSTLSSRITENNKSSRDYFIKNNKNTAPFASFHLSLLPFWTAKNHE